MVSKECGRKVTTVRSNAKTDDRLYLQLSQDDDMYIRIHSLVEIGLKVVICSNNASQIETIHSRLEKVSLTSRVGNIQSGSAPV